MSRIPVATIKYSNGLPILDWEASVEANKSNLIVDLPIHKSLENWASGI